MLPNGKARLVDRAWMYTTTVRDKLMEAASMCKVLGKYTKHTFLHLAVLLQLGSTLFDYEEMHVIEKLAS
jgi:hypothetical protein